LPDQAVQRPFANWSEYGEYQRAEIEHYMQMLDREFPVIEPAGSRHAGQSCAGGQFTFNEPNQTPSAACPPQRSANFTLSRALIQPGEDDTAAGIALPMWSEDLMDDGTAMPMQSTWSDIEIDVILDSGCSDHVMNVELDAPGYQIRPSAASRKGVGFIVGNGERVANEGESVVNLSATDERGKPMNFSSIFQSAKVTKPLMSVSKICSNGYRCNFTDQQAVIQDKQGRQVCTFQKNNGLYTSRLKLKAPSPFGRHE
jgi:hypothetical protein